MNLLDFSKIYPDEASCVEAFRNLREKNGLCCPVCGGLRLHWDEGHKSWICRDCGHETTLRSGTVMQNSKLPVYDWFVAMFLLTSTKHTFSAKEIQRQIGRKRYQPVWEMVHKLRDIMGKRDGKYTLNGDVELDEGFFTGQTPEREKDAPLKRGRGSQKKIPVLTMAESEEAAVPDSRCSTTKKVRHIKMLVLDDLKAKTEEEKISKSIDKGSKVTTDASTSYKSLKKNGLVKEHEAVVMADKKTVGKVLPWVHIAISNAKRILLDTYHDIKKEYLQYYLNEFCYKFNRRYFGFKLFDRLELCALQYQADFKHRIY